MALQPHEQIWQLATATVPSRTLHVVAQLGVADHVDSDPVTAKDLALVCGTDPGALERALLLLAAHGIFERAGEGFVHNDASRLLRSDHPMSMRAFARMMGMDSFTSSFAHLDHAVRSGAPSLDLLAPDGLFAHLQRDPEEAQIFEASMTSKAAGDMAAVIGSYDFSKFATIADVGGGRGHLLAAVLEAAPESDGTLFDLPSVIDGVDPEVERRSLVAGDFFVDPLPVAEAYILMEILHDWDDTAAAAILSNIRRAASPGSTVLIIEAIADDQRLDPVVHTLDVIMLAITGGRERTPAQLDELLRSTGFRLTTVLPTGGPMRIVEAVAS